MGATLWRGGVRASGRCRSSLQAPRGGGLPWWWWSSVLWESGYVHLQGIGRQSSFKYLPPANLKSISQALADAFPKQVFLARLIVELFYRQRRVYFLRFFRECRRLYRNVESSSSVYVCRCSLPKFMLPGFRGPVAGGMKRCSNSTEATPGWPISASVYLNTCLEKYYSALSQVCRAQYLQYLHLSKAT